MRTITGDSVTPSGVQSNSALTLTAFINLFVHGGRISGADGEVDRQNSERMNNTGGQAPGNDR